MPAASCVATIRNKKGLHARAAAKFVKTVASYDAEVKVTRLGTPPESLADESLDWTVSGSSILGLMMLAAEPGTQLELVANGNQQSEVIDALKQLIDARFDEDE